MLKIDIDNRYIDEADSKLYATQQIISFLRLPEGEAGLSNHESGSLAASKSYFSISNLPEGSISKNIFNWKTTNILDIEGRLLFRDQTLNLSSGNEIVVRTSANNLLSSPVWSIKAGPSIKLNELYQGAMNFTKEKFAQNRPEFIYDAAIVCYSYPKLGLLFILNDDLNERFVVDIGDLSIISLRSSIGSINPEAVDTVWTPYDSVVPSTLGRITALWERNATVIRNVPEAGPNLFESISISKSRIIDERVINPELNKIGQETNIYCAPAVAQMIFGHHGITKSQAEIAEAMKTNRETGSTPADQENAITLLSNNKLYAKTDYNPSFVEAVDELRENRPFKSGIAGHARACCGFKIEAGERNFLYIYDPWPPRIGNVYFEDYSSITHTNHMYIRPKLLT